MLAPNRLRVILRVGESIFMYAKFSFVYDNEEKTKLAREKFECILSRIKESTRFEELTALCKEAVKYIESNRVLLPQITGDQIIEGRLFLIATGRADFEKLD